MIVPHNGSMRIKLPARRRCWTQKVRIDGQAFYLTCGEYPNGAPGEIWIEASKENTFTRGVLGGLARSISIAMQSGTPLPDLINSLRGLNFPPHGVVQGGGSTVTHCTSVLDWVAQELEAAYLVPRQI